VERVPTFLLASGPRREVCNCEQNRKANESTPKAAMATHPVLLCIHRDPERLSVLQKHGYDLLTAANGHEGLQLFGSRPVDAVVLGYHLGLLDGSVIASEMKQVRPNMPIVMLAEPEELPVSSRRLIDVLVSRSDPAHFVWAAVHFALSMRQGNSRPRAAIRVAGFLSKSTKSPRRPKAYSSQVPHYDERAA